MLFSTISGQILPWGPLREASPPLYATRSVYQLEKHQPSWCTNHSFGYSPSFFENIMASQPFKCSHSVRCARASRYTRGKGACQPWYRWLGLVCMVMSWGLLFIAAWCVWAFFHAAWKQSGWLSDAQFLVELAGVSRPVGCARAPPHPGGTYLAQWKTRSVASVEKCHHLILFYCERLEVRAIRWD